MVARNGEERNATCAALACRSHRAVHAGNAGLLLAAGNARLSESQQLLLGERLDALVLGLVVVNGLRPLHEHKARAMRLSTYKLLPSMPSLLSECTLSGFSLLK